jgi:hypothetical protein
LVAFFTCKFAFSSKSPYLVTKMRFSSYTAALLGVASYGVDARTGLQSRQQYDRRSMAAAGRRTFNLPRQANSPYLNNATAKYAVNGTGLPDVDFDIGESYAGLLPIDDTGKELFFWFVPSANPNATDEIVLWLNGGPGCSSLDGFFHENGMSLIFTRYY